MIPHFLRLSLKRFLLLLAAYSVTRVLHLLWNWQVYFVGDLGEILYAFLLGLRFDTSAILYTNILLFVLAMAPNRVLANVWVKRVDLFLFAIINLFFIGLNFIDFDYVNFIGKRISMDLLLLRQDLEQHSLNILATYWHFCLALTVFISGLVWFYPRLEAGREKQKWWIAIMWRLAAVGLMITGMRGGYQFKPLHPMHAYFSVKHEMGLLVLNSPFTLIRSRHQRPVDYVTFGPQKEALETVRRYTQASRPPLGILKGYNVMVLIIESLSTEYIGLVNSYPGFTPYLDSLAKDSYFFKFNFANARRSIEGLPSILCGLPALMEEPIITSDFANNRLDCMPKLLGQRGYSTHFLHGAHNGSMHFDTFSSVAGFENFVGLNEYPKDNPDDLDKFWGVLDEPMLQYAAHQMDVVKKPAFMTVFTLSSHHPYYIPPQHQSKFPKGSLEIHESIGYADYSVKKFFETASTKAWFKNTIFIITGDHTQKSDKLEYQDVVGPNRVPLWIYIPGLPLEKLTYDRERITQHADILPTTMDLLGYPLAERLLLGQSVFDLGLPGRAYNSTGHSFWLLDSQVLVDMGRPDFPSVHYRHKGTFEMKVVPEDAETKEAQNNLKAIVQYFTKGLVENQLYKWSEVQ